MIRAENFTMTFLKTRFHLARGLNDADFEKFGQLSAVYGIRGLAIDGEALVVDYDASRIHEAEVLAEVRKFGLPVAPTQPIPAGAFDYTGEFKDFAWPTTGVSPANQKQK
jgi:hypothetical protein